MPSCAWHEPAAARGAPTAPDGIAYVATAARVADALTQDVLLAPIESSVIPLPHQIPRSRGPFPAIVCAICWRTRWDSGKTIEAGLIMRELKLRGLVRRTLVIAPKGLVTQWVAEMRHHFNEEFQLILPDDLKTLRHMSAIAGYPSQVASQEAAHPERRNPVDDVRPSGLPDGLGEAIGQPAGLVSRTGGPVQP